MGTKEVLDRTDDPRAYRMMRRRLVCVCAFCRPNRGENRKVHAAHGTRKARSKNHRR